jgi:TPR repeat protein
MRNLTATICLMIAVLLFGMTEGWSADFERDYAAAGKGLTAYSAGDYATALREFETLAEHGNITAQVMIGEMFDNGKGVKQDHVQAAEWYRKAANQGHGKAQYNLGGMYDSGQGVTQDYALAFHWFLKATHRGMWQAYFNVGNMYYEGKGVAKNHLKSFQYFKLAAETGSVIAQNRLAFRYYNGEGVKRSLIYAYMWWDLASSNINQDPILQTGEEVAGFPPAVVKNFQDQSLGNRDVIAQEMTSSQITEAQKLARECVRRNYKGC